MKYFLKIKNYGAIFKHTYFCILTIKPNQYINVTITALFATSKRPKHPCLQHRLGSHVVTDLLCQMRIHFTLIFRLQRYDYFLIWQ